MVLVFLGILVIGEILSALSLKNPKYIPGFAKKGFTEYYTHIHRNVIQVVEECAEYDPDFFYKLKPSSQCVFSNEEFSNKINTNKFGLRDGDSSLVKPEIIVLGDSYALGWGVEQEEPFPAVLQQLTGKKVLNAGMSSFGTARELRMLSRLDTSNLNTIIIQYCANDLFENKPYADKNYQLEISPRASYDSLVTKFKWAKVYYPGKYFLSTFKYNVKETIKKLAGRKDPDPAHNDPEGNARLFIDLLKRSTIDFSNKRVIVVDMNEPEFQDGRFISAVSRLANESPNTNLFKGNLKTLDVTQLLGPDDYYILDGHVRASGHRKIATELRKLFP